MRVWAQAAHCSTWPPSSAVRQSSTARMTRRWARLRCPALAARQAGPKRRKMSATSSRGRVMPRTGSGRWRSSELKQLERALDLPDGVQGDPGVARRRGDLPMPQQVLDHPDVDALLEQVGGEAVPQGVHGHRLVEPGGLDRLAAGPLHRARRDRAGRVRPWEQPRWQSGATPVRAQDHEQLRREHDVAVAPTLALADVDGHPGAVDVTGLEPDDLGDPQAGGVDRGQQRAHLPLGDGGQHALDLVLGEDGWQGVGLAWQRDLRRRLAVAERGAVEEAQSAHDRADAAGLEPAGDQVQLMWTALMWTALGGQRRAASA